MATNQYNGVENLLAPDNHALLLIDHQYLQLMSLTSHKPATVTNNATALAKAAKVFNVPTLLTTAFAERQALVKDIQAVFPDQQPIDRTGLNAWDDQRVVDWVKQTGRTRLVMAGLWTEVCLNLAVLSALGNGYDVYIVPDASGGGDAESHAMGVQRMVQAGAIPFASS
jgi:nicotinamidase-related amidase